MVAVKGVVANQVQEDTELVSNLHSLNYALLAHFTSSIEEQNASGKEAEESVRVELLNSVSNMRIKWDDTVFGFAKEGGTVDLEIDICKVMIADKNIIDQIICQVVDICNVPVLQFCGLELHMLEVSLVCTELMLKATSKISEYEKLRRRTEQELIE
ncbi:hypothetical protein BDF20DRAFT_991162 [Mycotypha africana]|uniref:uncharacterized protein n=1 Tax=Mycotypha africana TaxID=64632 RepID=UPI002300EB53|nr:uncharacterized protein BDF20DRAFT_991162 [Mycotypha africana]KAI8968191.1 hypothetical protein BDF20DRAFT_991162 [Mycotypha africana]